MNGVINIYKPKGMTSFDVVRQVKKVAETKKVGHTGTLDPEATGVLPVCIGKATKLVDYIMNDFKVYKALLRLGMETDTYDTEGKVIDTKEVNIDPEKIKSIIYDFIGENLQVPPMYSALKVNGKRLYELARMGVEIERQARRVNIYDIQILDVNLPEVSFIVKCSKGTYIRSLCHDIGVASGCLGTMWELERLATGNFDIANSVHINNLTKENIGEYLIPMESALNYKNISFPAKYSKALLNGVVIKEDNILKEIEENELCKVYISENEFIGIGSKIEDGFKMVKLLLEEI